MCTLGQEGVEIFFKNRPKHFRRMFEIRERCKMSAQSESAKCSTKWNRFDPYGENGRFVEKRIKRYWKCEKLGTDQIWVIFSKKSISGWIRSIDSYWIWKIGIHQTFSKNASDTTKKGGMPSRPDVHDAISWAQRYVKRTKTECLLYGHLRINRTFAQRNPWNWKK